MSALLGKPPVYVAYYTDTYKLEMQKMQFGTAVSGCLTGAVVYGFFVLLSVATN